MQRKLALIEARSRLNERFQTVHSFNSLDNFGIDDFQDRNFVSNDFI